MDNYLVSNFNYRVPEGRSVILAKLDSQEISSYLIQKDLGFMTQEIAFLRKF
jgi:hypothetical protein